MKTFRQILLTGLWIILLTTLGITGVSQNISVSGTIQENTVWAADTVNIVGDITVIKGVTLEIAAGTYIRAQGYYKINVAGTVNAIGTSENTIVFSVADTTGFISENNSYSGGWGGFHFCGEPENYGDASTLKYCRLEYGKCIDNPDGDYCGAAVYADYYRNLHVSNCTFENNRITKQATGDDQVFGAAIGCKNVDAIVIEESNFLHNTSFHRGGGVGIKGIVGYLLIDENEFIHNTARCYYEAGYSDSKMGSAIFCSDYAETSTCIPIVTRNSCFANDGTSTVCLACEHATVCNNLICNNDGEGVNIFHGKSYANVFNNTIAKNWEPINLGGWANGIVLGMSEYEFYSYHGAVFNNLSFRNYTDSALFIGDFFKEIYMASGTDSVDYFGNNCVTDLPSCTAGENGIYTSDAQFVNPTLGNGKNYYDPDADWSLMSESPCRDAGIILDNIDMPDVDFLGYERIVGTIDIGAIEYQVGPTYPTANFKADRVNINENAVVNFTDLSVNNPTSWEWTFEGGTPATSNQQNPSVTYNTAGVYDVSLTITNEFGSDYMIKEEYITVYLPYYPIAEFTADNVNVKETSIVNFTDLSTNSPFSWEWTFEGGTPATLTSTQMPLSTSPTYRQIL
jgi:PKD repeat protein